MALACSACGPGPVPEAASRDGDAGAQELSLERISVLTSLPIFWNESSDIAASLSGDARAHWALAALDGAAGEVLALDTLSALEPGDVGRDVGRDVGGGGDLLVLAQPRALSASENLALDGWVRAGGAVLLFADPMLDAHSIFAPGDPRRPQDVALLSPILARWGLKLFFDPGQDPAERLVELPEGALPVRLSGHFAPVGTGGDSRAGEVRALRENAGRCRIEAQGLLAQCKIGKGQVLLVADAALFDDPVSDGPARTRLLHGLIARIAPGL